MKITLGDNQSLRTVGKVYGPGEACEVSAEFLKAHPYLAEAGPSEPEKTQEPKSAPKAEPEKTQEPKSAPKAAAKKTQEPKSAPKAAAKKTQGKE